MQCPICDRDNARDARRCRSCGADFEDPELAAQLPARAGAADDDLNLTGDRYLGVRWIGLEVGGDLRRIALLGGLAFALAAALPLALDLQRVRAAWAVLGSGPTFALAVPMVLALVGIALATPLGKLVPAPAVAGVLAAGGALVLGGVVPRLAPAAGLGGRAWWAVWFGLAIGAAGIVLRVLRRRDPYTRWIIVAGAALVFIGMVVPYTDARTLLPAEYTLFTRDAELLDKSIGTASVDGFDAAAMVRFISMWHLLVFPLVGVAAGFALKASTGPWDGPALVLRPIGWAMTFWLPASMALYTLNVMGWHGFDYARFDGHYLNFEKFTTALFAGRGKLLVTTAPAMLWLVIGLAGLYVTVVAPRLPAATRTGPT
ncbi:MAG: hypothetical protein R3B06_22785 [Kofleriaceae bacterium]